MFPRQANFWWFLTDFCVFWCHFGSRKSVKIGIEKSLKNMSKKSYAPSSGLTEITREEWSKTVYLSINLIRAALSIYQIAYGKVPHRAVQWSVGFFMLRFRSLWRGWSSGGENREGNCWETRANFYANSIFLVAKVQQLLDFEQIWSNLGPARFCPKLCRVSAFMVP